MLDALLGATDIVSHKSIYNALASEFPERENQKLRVPHGASVGG
jgi:hypothetical protein